MAYFKVVLKGGHMGAGKSYDLVRYYCAQDMVSAFLNALSLSRVKKNAATATMTTARIPLASFTFSPFELFADSCECSGATAGVD